MKNTEIAFHRRISIPISENIMKPVQFFKRAIRLLALAGMAMAGLCSGPGAAAPAPAHDRLHPSFTKTGQQIDCDTVRYDIRFSYPAGVGLEAISPDELAKWKMQLRDKLPAGLTVLSATISGDVTGPGGGAVPPYAVAISKKELTWSGLHFSKTDLDGLGVPGERAFTVTIFAKIDRSKFPAPTSVSNQANLRVEAGGGTVNIKSHDPALPEGGEPEPTKIVIDVTKCPDDTGGGDGGDDAPACFRVETGEVECDQDHPGDFIYKMHVGAEFGGKTIELVATTPGVSIFPPAQVVPIGGGVLTWHISGAVPGMTVHLVANGLTDGEVKHVSGPKEGLGLCCVQKIEIVIPVDLDCPPPPPPCKDGDDNCPPPGDGCEPGGPDCPKPPCEKGDDDCPPPPPPCDPAWEECPCDPQKEDCGPGDDRGKPKLHLDKLRLDDLCIPNNDGETATCHYKIRIWNGGDAVYSGMLTVHDRYPNGAPVSSTFSPTPPWSCGPDGGPDRFICTAGIIVLPPAAAIDLTVTTVVKIADYANSHEVKNCASLAQEENRPVHCATIPVGQPHEPPSNNDPGDISIEKTGPSRCDPGKPCVFRITITNNSPRPFNGPVAIVDGVSNGGGAVVPGSSVSVTPPFGCDSEPTSLPFGCVAHVSLAAGQRRTHQLTVYVPASGTAQPGSLLKNCAMIGDPAVLDADVDELLSTAPGNDHRDVPVGRHTSCHSFEFGTAQCSNGMVLNNTGVCVCPAGTRWNGRRCFGKPPVKIPPVTVPPLNIADPVCPRGYERFRSFRGKPLGYELKQVNSHGKRIICGIPRCDRGWSLYHNRTAIPSGWRVKRIGRRNSRYRFWCAKPRKVENCPSGWHKFPRGQQPKGWNVLKRLYDNGRSVCAQPVREPLPLHCRKGWTQVRAGEIRGYKAKGYHIKRRGKGRHVIWCVKPGKQNPTCEQLGKIGKWPNCRPIVRHCPKGTVGKWPKCRPIVRHCPKGTVGKWPKCRPIVRHCPKGTVGKWPKCRPIVRHCPKGTVGKWPKCRKIVRRCPKGMIGKWPKCYKKPVIKLTCAQFGKVGRWPKCRKKRAKTNKLKPILKINPKVLKFKPVPKQNSRNNQFR